MKAAARRPALSSFNSFVNLTPSCQKSSRVMSDSINIHVRCPCSEGAEARGKEHTNVPDVDRQVKRVKNAVDDPTGRHKAWIDGTTDDATQGVPCCWVEPVPEFLKSVVNSCLARQKVGMLT